MVPDLIILLLAQATPDSPELDPFEWSNVTDQNGIPIAMLGMVIVFSALVLISLAIAALPRLLNAISPYLPQVEEPHDGPAPAESTAGDEEAVIAAIGFVLHSEMQKAMKK
ncbi:MAG: OadG family protein [Planctomycetaceae bacterium]|nr:OadG family protein [Planctomycetaceae bacterium]